MGNDTFGIAVASFCTGSPQICQQVQLDIDPDPDGNRIVSNQVTGNGESPDPTVAPFFAVDLAWHTTGQDNCWSDNTFGSSFPPALPACP